MGMAVSPEALILGRCSVWGNKVKNTEPAAYFARRLTGAQECARIRTISTGILPSWRTTVREHISQCSCSLNRDHRTSSNIASFALEWLKSGFLRFGTWGRSSNTTQQNPVLLGVLLVSLVTKYPNPHTRQQGVGKGPSFLKIHQSVCLGHRYTKVYLLRIPIMIRP